MEKHDKLLGRKQRILKKENLLLFLRIEINLLHYIKDNLCLTSLEKTVFLQIDILILSIYYFSFD